jgi:hypothetical protein
LLLLATVVELLSCFAADATAGAVPGAPATGATDATDATEAEAPLGTAPSASARDKRLSARPADADVEEAAALLSLSSAMIVAACDDAGAGACALAAT